jgi:hypothetical protein
MWSGVSAPTIARRRGGDAKGLKLIVHGGGQVGFKRGHLPQYLMDSIIHGARAYAQCKWLSPFRLPSRIRRRTRPALTRYIEKRDGDAAIACVSGGHVRWRTDEAPRQRYK